MCASLGGLTEVLNERARVMKSFITSICLCAVMCSMEVLGATLTVPTQYPTIQAAINAASPNDTIIVSPGTYVENINFYGKDITLTSTDPGDPTIVESTIIDGNQNGSVVTFSGSETPICVLKGFTISRGGGISGNNTEAGIINCIVEHNWDLSWLGAGLRQCDGLISGCQIMNNFTDGYLDPMEGVVLGTGGGLYDCGGIIINCIIARNTAGDGGGLAYCSAAIINCTIVNNLAGDDQGASGGGLYQCSGPIINSIIWNNTAWWSGDQLYDSSIPIYSCIQDWTGGGTGNINSDPLFADVPNDDYHLKSEYGRWEPPETILNDNGTPTDPNDDFWEVVSLGQWVYDTLTSPCIDAGDPASDWTAELWPHGGRINMGAYGGTPQASMSPSAIGNVADLDHDNDVDTDDFILLSGDWLYAEYLLDTDLTRDGRVDLSDFAAFANQWQWLEP